PRPGVPMGFLASRTLPISRPMRLSHFLFAFPSQLLLKTIGVIEQLPWRVPEAPFELPVNLGHRPAVPEQSALFQCPNPVGFGTSAGHPRFWPVRAFPACRGVRAACLR